MIAPEPEVPAVLRGVRERFEAATDFTVGIEEEYQLLDPVSLALVNRYEELVEAAEPALRERLAGELIASEVEFKTGAHGTFTGAARQMVRGRLDVIALADRLGLAVGVSGVHPFSLWTEQRIIDTPHYRRLDEELGYVAWTNNTWALHLHCGVHGADRAVAVTSAMRSVLPELLALSANSPVYEGVATRLASTRTQVFVRSFPRCGVPDGFLDWDEYAEHVALLARTGSIVESTQIRKILRTSGQHNIALFGAGNLGQAIATSGVFADHGFRISAIFDVDPDRVGTRVGDVEVRHYSELPQVVAEDGVMVGVLAVPGPAAQQVADDLVAAGVKIIFNYSDALLTVPSDVTVHTSAPAVELLYALYVYLT